MNKKYAFLLFALISSLLIFAQCTLLRKSYPTIIGTQCPAHDSCVVYEITFHLPLHHSIQPKFIE